jgi:hypothetical protein
MGHTSTKEAVRETSSVSFLGKEPVAGLETKSLRGNRKPSSRDDLTGPIVSSGSGTGETVEQARAGD